MNTLFLRLEGPLQAWGLRARWEERDSAFEPTKSGVIGLLGCALGLRRASDRLRELSEAFKMGVRVDRQGSPLVDYHTTGGATAADGEPEGMLNAEGKRKRETDVSKRVYLMDALFLVALQGPEALIAEAASALQNPAWPVFLGRKACVPSCPVFAGSGQFAELQAALLSQPLADRHDEGPIRLVLETTPGNGTLRNDAIGVPARRLFWPRAAAESFAPLSTFGVARAMPAIDTLEG